MEEMMERWKALERKLWGLRRMQKARDKWRSKGRTKSADDCQRYVNQDIREIAEELREHPELIDPYRGWLLAGN